ncbi:response regulator [Candidatus Uhrbacteria bacterium]|nr:response regulator [Candidatus Uhrbacteria bacterium]
MPLKILIVEDHPDSREILVFQLRHVGYETIEAANGPEGIEKAIGQGPDLIVMDLGLPGINGIDATVKLKQNPKTANIPVIAYTAWEEQIYKDRALEAGMAEFLTKPTPPKVFGEVLQRVLQSNSRKMASTA